MATAIPPNAAEVASSKPVRHTLRVSGAVVGTLTSSPGGVTATGPGSDGFSKRVDEKFLKGIRADKNMQERRR